jgi:hypothetical protein
MSANPGNGTYFALLMWKSIQPYVWAVVKLRKRPFL